MSLAKVLEHIRTHATRPGEKGARFETLVAAWLLSDPVFGGRIRAICVCSDSRSSRVKGGDAVSVDVSALVLFASTDAEKIAARILPMNGRLRSQGMTASS